MKIKELIANHLKECGHAPVIDPDDDGKGFGWKCDVCGRSEYAIADDFDDEEAEQGTAFPQVGTIDNEEDPLAGTRPAETGKDIPEQAPASPSLTEQIAAQLDQSGNSGRVPSSVTKHEQKPKDGE